MSDAGLAHFKDCKNLTLLTLGGTAVTEGGLARFAGCTRLDRLCLPGTRTTDAGLAPFKGCADLTSFDLEDTAVTDAFLDFAKDFKKLNALKLNGTKVTPAKVVEFKKAKPACKIEWDGGVLEPAAAFDPDRTAALWTLSVGGIVRVAGLDKEIKSASAVAAGEVRVGGGRSVAESEGERRRHGRVPGVQGLDDGPAMGHAGGGRGAGPLQRLSKARLRRSERHPRDRRRLGLVRGMRAP